MEQMNNQRLDIAKILTGLAEYYDKKLSPTQLALYVEDLMELSHEELLMSVRIYRNDPKNVFFPLPSKLKSIIRPAEDVESQAALIAEKIAHAISKIGPYGSIANLDATTQEVIMLAGGMMSLCEMVDYDNIGILKAQWRNTAKALLNRNIRNEMIPEQIENQDRTIMIDVKSLFKEMPK